MAKDESTLIKRRELIRRIAMAGAAPAIVAVIAGTTTNKTNAQGTGSGSILNTPPPPPGGLDTPEPGTILLTGLGIAGVGALAIRKKKAESGPKPESDSQ
jgi:hypothetical protein